MYLFLFVWKHRIIKLFNTMIDMPHTVNQLAFVCEQFPQDSRETRNCEYFSLRTCPGSRCCSLI